MFKHHYKKQKKRFAEGKQVYLETDIFFQLTYEEVFIKGRLSQIIEDHYYEGARVLLVLWAFIILLATQHLNPLSKLEKSSSSKVGAENTKYSLSQPPFQQKSRHMTEAQPIRCARPRLIDRSQWSAF